MGSRDMGKGGRAACAAAVVAVIGVASGARADQFSDAVLAQINFARTQPWDYAQVLRDQARFGDRDEAPTRSQIGDADDLREAISFLERQKPLSPLADDSNLADAAMAHVKVQSQSGAVGHGEADGTTLEMRLHRRGVWAGLAGENISYGRESSRGVVSQLIIDSGVPGRGHRANIFDPAYQYAGVACGPHRVYRVMCVIDFAGALAPRGD